MLGKVREAVADAAETLRRLFADPPVRDLPVDIFRAGTRALPSLGGQARPGLEAFPVAVRTGPRLEEGLRLQVLPPLQATLRSEEGWARWGAGVGVTAMAPLRAGAASGVAVPALPRRVEVRGLQDPLRRPAVRRAGEPLDEARTRRADPVLGPVSPRRALEAALALPIPFQGVDIQRLPKGLWMRYSLQMVRATGENVRNLEVLGLFRLPREGVADLRHDARRGRILVRLGAEAAGSPRAPFILARRRSDGALLSCYLEEP